MHCQTPPEPANFGSTTGNDRRVPAEEFQAEKPAGQFQYFEPQAGRSDVISDSASLLR